MKIPLHSSAEYLMRKISAERAQRVRERKSTTRRVMGDMVVLKGGDDRIREEERPLVPLRTLDFLLLFT